MLLPGSRAPDFALRDQNLQIVSLDSLKGHKSMIVFIPNPFTAVCEAELCAIRDGLGILADLDANPAAITCNTPFVNHHWAEENSFGFPVLSDFWPHGETSRAYGTFNERFGIPNRHTFILNAEGIVSRVIRSDDLAIGREFDLYRDALEQI